MLKYQKAAMSQDDYKSSSPPRWSNWRACRRSWTSEARAPIRDACARWCWPRAGVARSATPDDCHVLRKHGHRAEAQTCYESLTQHARSLPARRRRLGPRDVRGGEQRIPRRRGAIADSNAIYRVRWGRLLHERFNNTDAENLFKEALQRDPKERPGLSRPRARQRGRLRQQGRSNGPRRRSSSIPSWSKRTS